MVPIFVLTVDPGRKPDALTPNKLPMDATRKPMKATEERMVAVVVPEGVG